MVHVKPTCPMCRSNANVHTLGGGTAGMYRYKCKRDNHTFQRPRLNQAGVRKALPLAASTISHDAQEGKRLETVYRCSMCGAKKRGHVCLEKRSQDDAIPTDYYGADDDAFFSEFCLSGDAAAIETLPEFAIPFSSAAPRAPLSA